ncbi:MULTISPECIES: PH domain-containing protein [Actinomyces]|uniref:PH domain-containing protein n=1 Tax=Actinomyces respiraculi TaxID=2744574 RepID=A0A7T0PX67_9ACTO|nr:MULTISPECIES: PH domain-containing protein [Actinomyces]QPL05320.1 PH domain-containing protein [Actinomyces respiraculi]
MALSKKLLSRDEVVVRHMHTHIKVLLWRILLQILLLAAAIVGSVLAPDSWQPWGWIVIWTIVVVVAIPLFIAPWLRWSTTTYTVTSKRVITRSGIINKVGHDLPLSRISDVQQERTLTDRIFGAGTLRLQTSSDDPLILADVPQAEIVQVEISNLLFHDIQGAIDADPTD